MSAATVLPSPAAVSARWMRPRARGLCPVCAWMYRTADDRRTAHIVTSVPDRVVAADTADVFRVLSAPLPSSVSVLLPGADGVDVLPHAQWGHVSVPGATLSWSQSDADAVAAMGRLRRRDFSAVALTDITPPMSVLRTLPMREWERTYADWAAVDPWRADPPRWRVAVHVTSHVRPRSPGWDSRAL